MNAISRDRPITIAILAVGGQGGGVLTDWLVALAERSGWYVQATSVPGVAQRTGATIYYLEMLPASGREPVLSMMPAPGDVDIVIAAELMEAGRAIQRGLVTPDRTTLIASSHRALGILEKSSPGDGIADAHKVAGIARRKAKRFVSFDMQRLAEENGSVISASLFGALAGAQVLPFKAEDFEATIEAGGKGVEASLRAFRAAREAVSLTGDHRISDLIEAATKTFSKGPVPVGPEKDRQEYERALERVKLAFPAEVGEMIRSGLRHVVDYQDVAYGHEYLDRLADIASLDRASGGADHGWALTREAAKYLANAMAYDDVIRVADLKTRAARMTRIRGEVKASNAEVIHITEFMHPRVEEIAGTMPAKLGAALLARPRFAKAIDRVVNRGRHVRTNSIFWYLVLYALSGMKPRRRKLHRHGIEEAHIAAWLSEARRVAPANYPLAVEVIKCRRLIKGYSDTHARGDAKFDKVLAAIPLLEPRSDGADWLRRLREAALLDEEGKALDGALKTVATL